MRRLLRRARGVDFGMEQDTDKPEESGELMYVKCAYCGKWLDVKPGQINWVSHGICDECLQKELRKSQNPSQGENNPTARNNSEP